MARYQELKPTLAVVAALALSTAAAAAAGCPANCSLAGACQPNGRCLCDAPFTGPSCQQLEQLPAAAEPAFVAPKGSMKKHL